MKGSMGNGRLTGGGAYEESREWIALNPPDWAGYSSAVDCSQRTIPCRSVLPIGCHLSLTAYRYGHQDQQQSMTWLCRSHGEHVAESVRVKRIKTQVPFREMTKIVKEEGPWGHAIWALLSENGSLEWLKLLHGLRRRAIRVPGFQH